MRLVLPKPERVNFVTAVDHGVGKARAAKEHADDRPRQGVAAQRDQLAGNNVRAEVRLREQDESLERDDWVALCTEVEGDEVGLAVRENRNGRRLGPEVAAVMNLGQRGLHRPVTAVDDQDLRADACYRAKAFTDLLGTLNLVMENVGVVGAIGADARKLRDITRRLRVRQQCDPWTGHSTR